MVFKKIIIFIIFSLILISCKNSQDNKLVYTDVETVKNNVKNHEENTVWTKEIEGTRLTETVNNNKNISNEVIVTPTILKIFSDYQQPIYPEFLDFGKLDTSKLDDKTKEKVNEFSEKISKNIYSGAESYFSTNYIFNYIFFSEEFVSNWKSNFDKEFPYTKEEIKEYTKLFSEKESLIAEKNKLENEDNNQISDKSESIKNDNNLEQEQKNEIINSDLEEQKNKEKIKRLEEINKKVEKLDKKLRKYNIEDLFKKWIIGEPFYGEKILQIPIRFYCNDGTVDVTLYLNKENNLIYQITIDRWEKV